MEKQINLTEILPFIDPSMLSYQEWVNVGMALKHEGYSSDIWENWSRNDNARYHPGECQKKWESFNGNAKPVTGGTIVQLAKNQGWNPLKENRALDWDDVIGEKDEICIVDKNWIEGKEISEPAHWDPVKQLITYIETLFESNENVGYVTRSYEEGGKKLPTKGCWDRTAGRLIQQLSKCNGDIGAVLGDYDTEAGAWIRFNPLDGKGVKNENVTDFRYALVESDNMELDRQNAIIRELELPVACLMFSGGKSLHAIVKIDAADYNEYRKRVDFLYSVCQKNGFKIDSQNRNPSRLSRLPGVMRGQRKQFLIDTNIGKENWAQWVEWIESVNDNLPEPENMADAWNNLPELAPPLIDGVLRQGHKMLLAGPSKAGKSYALIELCCAIAEGYKWFDFPCSQGRVMYVNLELDRASCLHRFKDVYTTLNLKPVNLANIDIWNLRGKTIPMDKLAPKLIRRAAKKNYIAIILDPIYKVITGDENSADQMAHFCNQFDKVCTELGCAVIYCHHHSKGAQGGKRSMDRASGSGVFARDPDALLDLVQLEPTEALIKQEQNKKACQLCCDFLENHVHNWEEEISQDDMCSEKIMTEACKKLLNKEIFLKLEQTIKEARKKISIRTAWRIEGTLREFPKFEPLNLWFDYPIHHMDYSKVLKDVEVEGEKPAWQRAIEKRKPKEKKEKERKDSIENAYNACNFNGKVYVKDLAEYMGVTEKTVRNRLKAHGDFWVDDGEVGKKT